MEFRDWLTGGVIALVALLAKFLHWHAGTEASRIMSAHNDSTTAHRNAWVDWNHCNAREDRIADKMEKINEKLDHISGIVEAIKKNGDK